MWYNQPQQQQVQQYHHQMEGFLMWLRGEFAAANAIIDALCHHLRGVGDKGEYDDVIACIQQRRCHWNPVLHMQHYFSVADVVNQLHHVGRRRQHQGTRAGGRLHRGPVELNNASVKNVNEKHNAGVVEEEEEKKVELNGKSEVDCLTKSLESTQGALVHIEDSKEVSAEGSCNVDGYGVKEQLNLKVTPKTFVATEICDGKPVNVVDGMKLYEELFADAEISQLTSLVTDLRAAGKSGKLQGQTFVILKRPMKGHGREMIQFGIPSADGAPEDQATAGTSKDVKTEPIPALLQDVIDRLLTEDVVSIKPDSCTIDIFNEGDHSQPHIWPQWFGRPVCLLFLTECEMSFGKVIAMDHSGNYQGALKLSLSPGSILVMQGRSSDFTRHAIPSDKKQRILITFTKSQPKKTNSSEHHFPSVAACSPHRIPPPSKPPSHVCPVAAEYFHPVPSTVIYPTSTTHQQIPPPNNIQHMYVPTTLMPPPLAFAAPVALSPASAGWPAPPLRHAPPRLPVPGTGVFLPSQSSGNSSDEPASTVSTENITLEASNPSEGYIIGISKSTNTSPEVDGQAQQKGSNGSTDGTINGGTVITKKQQHQNVDSHRSD